MTEPKFQDLIRAEMVGSDQCSAAGLTIRAAAPILNICRALLAAGHDPASKLEAYRGAVLCMTIHGIARGAQLTVDENRMDFRRWEPFSLARVAPPVRVKVGALVPSLKNAFPSTSAAVLP